MKYILLISLICCIHLGFGQVDRDDEKDDSQQYKEGIDREAVREREQMTEEERNEAEREAQQQREQRQEEEQEQGEQHREQKNQEASDELASQFENMVDSFRQSYQSLAWPQVYPDYVQTIKQINSKEALSQYESFVNHYSDYLKKFDRQALSSGHGTSYDMMQRLVDQLSSFTYLRKEMINRGEKVLPGGLDGIYKGDLWYRYFFKYYNGGHFTEVRKLKAYTDAKIKAFQRDIEWQMQEMGFEDPGNFYQNITAPANYVKDRNQLEKLAQEKVDNVLMGAGNLFGINLPELTVQLSDQPTRLEVDEKMLHLQFPEGGYPIWDLDYDIIRWVAGYYLLEQLPESNAYLVELINTRGFEDAWALYVTKHGKRFQLYRNPLSKAGEAMNRKYHAVLSRIDIGLHLDGWDEQRALDYYKEFLPWLDNGQEMINEIMQKPAYYSVAPWNAFQIENKRINAPIELGQKIQPAVYYDMLLKHGVLPMDMIFKRLEAEVQK